jgi:hypothetical protein
VVKDDAAGTRFDVLDKAGAEILARKDELGRQLAREQGKPVADGVMEAVRAGMIFKFFAGEALRMTGDRVDSTRPGVDVEVTREPLGVVAAITRGTFRSPSRVEAAPGARVRQHRGLQAGGARALVPWPSPTSSSAPACRQAF